VVLAVPIARRRVPTGGLRIPTALDAWGHSGFVPSSATPPRSWPSKAGWTVDPTDRKGRASLPEAIHGRLNLRAGSPCSIISCSEVKKANPSRVEECGNILCGRVLEALRLTS
jgi:hypothetical protein